MDDNALVTYSDLSQEFGITYSRTHVARIEKAGRFPKRFKPFQVRGARFYYRRREILAWLSGKWPA